MAKAATSGQARAFNAMLISRLDEEVLERINSEKFQKAIDEPNLFIPLFIELINEKVGSGMVCGGSMYYPWGKAAANG